GLAAAFVGFVVLLRTERQRALNLCICAAAFFSAAPLRIGPLRASDAFLLCAVAMVVLKPATIRRAPLPRGLLLGLALLILGGTIGSLFQPSVDPYYSGIGILWPTKFLGLPPRFGEIIRLSWSTIGVILLVAACRLTRRQVNGALIAFGVGGTASALWGIAQPFGSANRASGLTGHPVYLGLVSVFVVMVGLALLVGRAARGRLLGAAITAAGVVGV